LHLQGNVRRGTVVPDLRPDFGASYEVIDQRFYRSMRGFVADDHGPWHAAVSRTFVDQLDMTSNLAPHYPASMAQGSGFCSKRGRSRK